MAGTPVPPTSGALYIFLWKMPTEVSHNIHLLLLVSVTLFVERVKLEFDLQFTSASLKLHHVSTKNMSATQLPNFLLAVPLLCNCNLVVVLLEDVSYTRSVEYQSPGTRRSSKLNGIFPRSTESSRGRFLLLV